jgi:LPXTG-motif cell wall-anchored protein
VGNLTRVLVGMGIIAAPVIGMAVPARADGGPSGFFATQTPIVDCHAMSIDPPWVPNAVWPVTFHGTINDKPFSRTVDFFSQPDTNATVETSDLMAAPGPLHVVVTVDSPQWGTSPTEATTISCHSRAAETTTSSKAASETATTALAVLGVSVTAEPPVTVANVLGQSAALPRTGSSSSVPLGAIGLGAAGVGSMAMVVGRRRLTRHGLRRGA